MKQQYRSNGKLLISGEYGVLDGTLALAIPTQYGQTMEIIPHQSDTIIWKNYDHNNKCWFEVTIPLDAIQKAEISNSNVITHRLLQSLKYINDKKPRLLTQGYTISNTLDFPRAWGLGTSSTYIHNLAQWSGVDPYELLWNSFQGSGYDLACAGQNTPITYQLLDHKPLVNTINFNPNFTGSLYFVYLNKKQDTQIAIDNYRKLSHEHTDDFVKQLSALTSEIMTAQTLQDFAHQLQQHENTVSKCLGILKVQEVLFDDFEGVVKSLGAWGGDFVLVASAHCPMEYFKQKGYDVIIRYDEMVKH